MGLILDARGSPQTLFFGSAWVLCAFTALCFTPLLGQTGQIPLHNFPFPHTNRSI